MIETMVQTQVRLLLERQCAEALAAWILKFRPQCDVTLITFDYTEVEGDDAGDYSNVAYKTSLDRVGLIELLEARLARWADPNAAILAHDRDTQGWLPDGDEMRAYASFLREQLSESVGFSLFCGRGQRSQYISEGDRRGVAALFRDDLLPGLRGRA